ncbi:MAG TPA: hypothetical protein VHF67_00255 [Gaiellaceae bacterium]|nr:hypothetical protein [Gaiellaceae bacterium]
MARRDRGRLRRDAARRAPSETRLVDSTDLKPTLVVLGGIYLLATFLPLFDRSWRAPDHTA